MRLSRWLPLAICLVAVTGFSGEAFSSQHSARLITPWVQWLSPLIGGGSVAAWNAGLRKTLHVLVYGALALCWYRALAWDDGGRRSSSVMAALSSAAIAMAFLLTVAIGGMDEVHQRFVPSRTGQVSDVMLDGMGAALALLCRRGLVRAGVSSTRRRSEMDVCPERG
ncbi:MAG TPA: VanZ family protein [Candidatus Baltobacteraceae bacterium]|nr:VanZ family protein [Candidatus Baltobacteraceae bacterium]